VTIRSGHLFVDRIRPASSPPTSNIRPLSTKPSHLPLLIGIRRGHGSSSPFLSPRAYLIVCGRDGELRRSWRSIEKSCQSGPSCSRLPLRKGKLVRFVLGLVFSKRVSLTRLSYLSFVSSGSQRPEVDLRRLRDAFHSHSRFCFAFQIPSLPFSFSSFSDNDSFLRVLRSISSSLVYLILLPGLGCHGQHRYALYSIGLLPLSCSDSVR
jgi:hypothetical protein